MQQTKIKICGLRDAELATVAVEAGADMVGLVFVEKSPRYINYQSAREITQAVGENATTVALVMHPDDNLNIIDEIESEVQPVMYQLHGRSDAAAKLIEPARVIRTVSFDPATIEKDLIKYDDDGIYGLIVDTPDPTKIGGGTGKVFNWAQLHDAINKVSPAVDIILAGGLNAENVKQAIKVIQPMMVDVSSGVEIERGVKDPAKIIAFCKAVHEA